VTTCIAASGIHVTAPVMSPRACFCITSNLFTVAGVVIFSVTVPYFMIGFKYCLHIAFSIDVGLSDLLPASLFRTLVFPYFFN
jgi:hypothetical protein